MTEPTTTYEGDRVLEVMSECAVNRNNAVEKIIRKSLHLGESNESFKLLEVGPGQGEFLNRFKDNPQLETFFVEKDEHYVQELSANHQGGTDLDQFDDSYFDGIYLIDVLEHIEQDREHLSTLYKKLKPTGRLLIYVPARMELYSEFDRSIGHFRRYEKQELKTKVLEAGFEIDMIRFHDHLGYFAAYYNKLFSKNGELNSNMVRIYDRFLFPLTDFLEGIVPPLIGKSLYCVATKPAKD